MTRASLESTDDLPPPDRSGTPLLVYDGSCGFCVATAARLVNRGVLELEDCRPLQSFSGEARERLFEAGIRNELVVVEPGGAYVSGVDGLRALFEHAGRGFAAGLLTFAPTRALAVLAYGILASNRRVLAPVDAEVRARCDCDPEPRAGSRIAFVILLLGVALAGAAALGALFGAWSGAGAWTGAAVGLAVPALLVLGSLLVLPAVPKGMRGEAVAHVAWQAVLAVGVGVLAASAVLLWAAGATAGVFLFAVATRWGEGLRLLSLAYPLLWYAVAVLVIATVVIVYATGMRDRLRALGVRA